MRTRVLKTHVWSTSLFGCIARTNREIRRRLEVVKMWLLGRMLRVSWTARMTNQEVMQRAGVSWELTTVI